MSGTLYVAPEGFEDATHYMPVYGSREFFIDGLEGGARLDGQVLFINKKSGEITRDLHIAALQKIDAMTPVTDTTDAEMTSPPSEEFMGIVPPPVPLKLDPGPPPLPDSTDSAAKAAPQPSVDPMFEKARALVEELRRVPSWWGVSFRGFTRESQFGLSTRSAVARGLVPASRNLRMATENFSCAGAYAIVGPDGRAIESIAIEEEQEIVFLPGTFFQFVGDYEVDGFPIRLVNQTTINPADRAQVDWDNIRNRVAALHEHETKKVKGNYRIYTPGKFVGDID